MTDPSTDILYRAQNEIRAMQDSLIKETIEICYEGHPFYRKLMQREGLTPQDVQSIDDLARLPITTKADFLEDPEAFRIKLDSLPLEQQTLWSVVYTTGTTSGKPAPIYATTFDVQNYMFACRRHMGLMGLRETDVVANLFPLTPFPMGAFSRAVEEMSACGIAMVYGLTGRSSAPNSVHRSLDEAVRMVERHRVTVLWGVAGFVRRVLVRAEQLGADFSSLRMAMFTGEATSVAMRNDMSDRMIALGCAGAEIVNRYGSTEQSGSMIECQPGSGFHNLAPDQLFHEVSDPESGQRLPDGETGMLTFSHLQRRGTVFLRYAVGDVVSMQAGECPHCGRTSTRMTSNPVRKGDIIKVKGTLVNLQALKDELEAISSLEEYQIIIQSTDANDIFAMDELVVQVAAAERDQDDVVKLVVDKTVSITNIKPRVELVHRDQIFDPVVNAKPRRVVDKRVSI